MLVFERRLLHCSVLMTCQCGTWHCTVVMNR